MWWSYSGATQIYLVLDEAINWTILEQADMGMLVTFAHGGDLDWVEGPKEIFCLLIALVIFYFSEETTGRQDSVPTTNVGVQPW